MCYHASKLSWIRMHLFFKTSFFRIVNAGENDLRGMRTLLGQLISALTHLVEQRYNYVFTMDLLALIWVSKLGSKEVMITF